MAATRMTKKTCSDREGKVPQVGGLRATGRILLAVGVVIGGGGPFFSPALSHAAPLALRDAAATSSGFSGPAFSGSASPDARPPAQRVVQGRVLDKKEAPIIGAVVYLKDTRSLAVKSYLTDESGRFHFGQLADGADYEIWAEQNGKRSSSKTISQFNSKLDIQFTLKIDLAD